MNVLYQATPDQRRAMRYIQRTRRRREAQAHRRTKLMLYLLIAASGLFLLAVGLAHVI